MTMEMPSPGIHQSHNYSRYIGPEGSIVTLNDIGMVYRCTICGKHLFVEHGHSGDELLDTSSCPGFMEHDIENVQLFGIDGGN